MAHETLQISDIINMEGTVDTVGVNYDDFDNACRSCLSKDGTVNLFQISHEEMLLSEIFEKLLASSEVSESDHLPTKLCSPCTAFVMHYYTFRKRALDSEIILQTVCREQKQVRNPLDDRNDFKIEIVFESDTEIKQEVCQPYESLVAYDHDYIKCNDIIKTEMPELLEFVKVEGDMQQKVKKKNQIQTIKCSDKIPSKIDANITCSFCEDIFPTLSEYLIHRKREASKRRKKLPCKYCNKLVKTNVLRDHMNTHTKEQPYECNVCKATFSMRSSLLRHKYRHSDKKPLECQACGKGFIQAALLEDHLRKHTGEKLICGVCQMEFSIKRRFIEHVKSHTSGEEVVNLNTKGPVNCKTCGEQLLSAYKLRNHMNRHREGKFACSICDKYFRTKHLLKVHVFGHTGLKPHICEICGKGFKQKAQLQSHNMTHTGEKPLLCVICGRRFSWKGHLDHHMRTHTGERPYECSFCGMTFSRPDYVKNHLRTHTGEKPFACDVCPKTYRYSDSLKKHKRTHEI